MEKRVTTYTEFALSNNVNGSTGAPTPRRRRPSSPGLYVEVAFLMLLQAPAIVVPDAALVFSASGLQVATVDAASSVRFQRVTIYRDFGTTAELHDGLQGGESLIRSPPTDLADSSKVHIANPPPKLESVRETASRGPPRHDLQELNRVR
jgi:hypothetical protein